MLRSRWQVSRLVLAMMASAVSVGAQERPAEERPNRPGWETGGADVGSMKPEGPPVRVRLLVDKSYYQAGEPIWADFIVTNRTTSPISLRVPDRKIYDNIPRRRMPPIEEMEGLAMPLGHIFSGKNDRALTIRSEDGTEYDAHTYITRRVAVPQLDLAPLTSVGMRLELTNYYELLKRPGEYSLTWKPYGGEFESNPVKISLLAEQQAIINTSLGRMTMRFHYEEAPRHVANFIDLAKKRFYRNLSFHRVIPGGLIQGGDPRGDGRGIRPDGTRLKAEFNSIPFEFGTVGMARSPRDPDSASCQFFICLSRQPSFDGKQTAFAYLVGDESFETLNRIAAVPTDGDDRPLNKVYIKSVTLESVPMRRDRIVGGTSNPRERLPSETESQPVITQPSSAWRAVPEEPTTQPSESGLSRNGTARPSP